MVHIDDITVDFEDKIVKKDGEDISNYPYKSDLEIKIDEDTVSLVFR